MYISCSSREEIWEIPQSGAAKIAGYWNPEETLVCKPSFVKWQNGKVSALGLWDDNFREEEFFPWHDYYLVPGWLDAHVHLALDGIDFQRCFDRWPEQTEMDQIIKQFLKHYLELGVVGIRDGGDLPGYAWRAKEKINTSEWLGPEILSVREAVYRSGHYGRFLGQGVNNLKEWEETKDVFFEKGLDQLKVIVTGLISFHRYGVVGPVQWSVTELRQLVRDAHERGFKVMGHVSGTDGISVAIQAGLDSIEHGYYVTKEQLQEISDRGIAWVPTVAPVGNLLTRSTRRYTLEEKEILRRILRGHLESIYEAYTRKVSLGIGTDAGAYHVPHGDGVLDEMTWFAEAGVPTLDVRKIATLGNAKILEWEGFGRLEPGVLMNRLQLSDQLFRTKTLD
ncbi:amidohydrolase family protein [Paradesulfitobacterium aromaticivorans]